MVSLFNKSRTIETMKQFFECTCAKSKSKVVFELLFVS